MTEQTPNDGRQRITRTMAGSQPWWAPRTSARPGAPNVVVMLADDLGYSDLGCYGSEIPTPHLDAVADAGYRYSDFHVTPLCSPTRAALLTGRNSHAVGVGIVTNIDPGFPGYVSELPENQPTIADIMRANGYATMMVGKWHLTKDTDLSDAADRSSWPLQHGFEQYYGFLEAMTDFHKPHRMTEGNSAVDVDEYPDDYYLTDDLTDRAVRMIRESKAARPDKPFFLYYSHGAVHAPLQAKQADIERHRDRYRKGWDQLREERRARQVELGILPADAALPPRNHEEYLDVAAWDDLPEREQQLFARYMEIYAAMVGTIDESVGRLRSVLEEMGEWENTVFVFLSDNGASKEGLKPGTRAYMRRPKNEHERNHPHPSDFEAFERGLLGGPATWPHYPQGWAMASNTPFRLYKTTTYRGGHQVPFILSWPGRLGDHGGAIRTQFAHVVDVVPTLVELLDLDVPRERHGRAAEPFDGASMVPSLSDPSAPASRTEQYWECMGNRGYHKDGWEAVTMREHIGPFYANPDRTDLVPLSEDKWALFDVANDPTQTTDLADEYPDRLAELKTAWDEAAWRYDVYPLHEGTGVNHLRRPEYDRPYEQPVRIVPGTPVLERHRSNTLINGRSFRIVMRGNFGGEHAGVLVSQGGQEGGYVVYIEDGQLHVVQNAFGTMKRLPAVDLADGAQEIVLDVTAHVDGSWSFAAEVDGHVVEQADGFEAFHSLTPWCGISVGRDARSPVSWELFQRRGIFPYDGVLEAAEYVPGEPVANARELAIERAEALASALE